MAKTVNVGGDRLGSGKKMQISMHGYERSNHDLSFLWKSTMSPGTLVPFMQIVALPGDTFDIDLDSIVKTHPTIGPLFGSFKLQLDIFSCPIRLYNKILHNNKLGLGMDMKQVKFPQMRLTGEKLNYLSNVPLEFQQINQSSLLAYLGNRGLGYEKYNFPESGVTMDRNAIPLLCYWDIFKNYYANKQEDFAYAIKPQYPTITASQNGGGLLVGTDLSVDKITTIEGLNINGENVKITLSTGAVLTYKDFVEELITWQEGKFLMGYPKLAYTNTTVSSVSIDENRALIDVKPQLFEFELSNIDQMRDDILTHVSSSPLLITDESLSPYNICIDKLIEGNDWKMNALTPQCGLAVKTYQSDLFNNWLNYEWIESQASSISQITAISTAEGSFTIDTLNLSKKVYDMLNRIAISGGSYEDWLSAVYDHDSKWRAETPIYCGGLSREILFQEVVSQSATNDEPLGSLAGKGVMGDKKKGGHMIINIDEPSYIMGIVSITPRIDYSQGNDWDTHLETLDDLHKPALDGIGFQDLLTDQAVFWNTQQADDANKGIYNAFGKVPAWINYMTAYNKSYGNFADPRTQMFMTLNRRYTLNNGNDFTYFDMTTYIDPAKFNYCFAQTDLSAMNFWTQIAININARRKMSAKIIPNL